MGSKLRAGQPQPWRWRVAAWVCVWLGLGLLALLHQVLALRLLGGSRLQRMQQLWPGALNGGAGAGSGVSAVRPALLDVTSMWGMGADARMPMMRRTRVPLVTWAPEAVARIDMAWRELQNPRSCDRVMYMYPYYWGLTSQIRDYSDMAIVALAFRRTLHYVEDAYRIKWCGHDAWLECFFEPLTNEKCRRKQAQLKDDGILTISAWDERIKGMALLEDETVKALAGPQRVIHLKNETRFNYVVEHPSLFPHELWESLVRDGLIRCRDDFGHSIDLLDLKASRPALYHTLSLSALRTMLTPIVFKPQPRLDHAAAARVLDLTRAHHDCVAVHLRWTDKRDDGGIALKRYNHSAAHVVAALDRIERRSGNSYQCLLVLSDDDVGAVKELNRLLGDTYDIKQVSQIQALFRTREEYDEYRLKGHEFFTRGRMATESPARTYGYIRDVLVDVLVAAKASDYLIGVGSSGVSQLLAQYMGASRRADANGFAIWEEDEMKL